MLRIKLQPTGRRNQKSYRIVVAEDRSKLTGEFIALLGTYQPLLKENTVKIDQPLYQSWLEKGAIPTDTVKSLVAKIS